MTKLFNAFLKFLGHALPITFIVACVLVIGGAIIGWGMNIYKLAQLPFEAAFGFEAGVRFVGILAAPVGALMGWM